MRLRLSSIPVAALAALAGCGGFPAGPGGRAVEADRPAFVGRRPDLVITREEARKLFAGRPAKMIIHYPGPRMVLFRSRETGPVYLVDFERDPLGLELVVPDAGSGLLGDPTICPDGERIAFWKEGSIYAARLRAGGSGRREIGEGFDQRWWRHPVTGEDYLIWVGRAFSHGTGVDGTTYTRKLRRGTCEPEGPVKILIADYAFRRGRTPCGRYMCTALPGWALAELRPEAVEDAFVGIVHSGRRMCNASMSQDPEHPIRFLWSPRRHDRMHYDPDDPGAAVLPPEGYGHIQWPEWSTHPDYVTASPSVREDDATPAEHDAFVYQWSTGKWTIVARKAYATHLWVGERDGEPARPTAKRRKPEEPKRLADKAAKRPTGTRGLVFRWDTGTEGASVFDAEGRPLFKTFYRPEARGLALFDRDYALRLEGGAFVATGTGRAILEAVRKSRAFTFELTVTPSERNGEGELLVAALGSGRRTAGLSLRLRRLSVRPVVFALTVGLSGAACDFVLASAIRASRPTQVTVAYEPGRLTSYLDGKVALAEDADIDFGSWRPCPVVLGDPEGRGRGWIGLLEGVRLHARALPAEEVAARAAELARLAGGREPPARLVVEAELLARSVVPAPEDTVYDRGYAVFEYEAVSVIEGRLEAARFRVARWAEMANRRLEAATSRVGEVHRLVLEPFDENPQMEDEQAFDTLEPDFELPFYYDAGPISFAGEGGK
jgi:hypothetical protein